jgi:hypothetical protein
MRPKSLISRIVNLFSKPIFTSLVAAAILFSLAQPSQAAPNTGRTWVYGNLTALLSPNWAFVVMPGHRYEYSRSYDEGQDEFKTFFYELFAGPVYIQKLSDNLTLKLPLWYYYMGFDFDNVNSKGIIGDYLYSHNIEFLPILEYKMGNFVFMNRVIFHNKIYADNKLYDTDDRKSGYSLLIREKLQITYLLNKKMGLIFADEIFIGAVEDEDTKDIPSGEPFYAKKKFNKNRVYLGMFYKVTPMTKIVPQYILETNYLPEKDYELKDVHHYINFTVSHVLKLF